MDGMVKDRLARLGTLAGRWDWDPMPVLDLLAIQQYWERHYTHQRYAQATHTGYQRTLSLGAPSTLHGRVIHVHRLWDDGR